MLTLSKGATEGGRRVELRPEYVLGVPPSGRTARGGVPAPPWRASRRKKTLLATSQGRYPSPATRMDWKQLPVRAGLSRCAIFAVSSVGCSCSPTCLARGNEVSAYSHQRERSGGTLENGSKLFLALTTSPHEAQKASHGRSQSFPRRRAIACIVRPCSGLVALPGCTSTAALVSRPPETRTAERRADGTACGVLIFGVIPTAI